MQDKKMNNVNYWKLIFASLWAIYFIICIVHADARHFVDSIDLIFHEAGHWIFIILGQFISVLGGSLNQILIPFICAGYFFVRKDYFSAAILAVWCGYNFVNVSIYMRDAIIMQLPLLGGDGVIHDWNFIFSSLNLLKYTYLTANITYFTGIVILIFGLIFSFRFASKYDRLIS